MTAFLTQLVIHGSAPAALLGQADPVEPGTSLLKYVHGGGLIGYIIIALSIAAVALVVVHAVQLRRSRLLPEMQQQQLSEMLGRGEVEQALQYCMLPEHDSYLTRIMAPGLTRFLRSAFGSFEVKTALEEAGEEQTARLYRSTDALGVIGSIAPLLGLLGTVQGMIGAFDTVATGAVNTSGYYEQLAGNISLALITTLQGLVVAIPTVALFTFFRNRIDAYASEAAQVVEQLAILLETVPTRGGQRAAPARTGGV